MRVIITPSYYHLDNEGAPPCGSREEVTAKTQQSQREWEDREKWNCPRCRVIYERQKRVLAQAGLKPGLAGTDEGRVRVERGWWG